MGTRLTIVLPLWVVVRCVSGDSTTSLGTAEELQDMSVQELQRLINECELSHSDCFEKHELQARAWEALQKHRLGQCHAAPQRAPPSTTKRSGKSKRTGSGHKASSTKETKTKSWQSLSESQGRDAGLRLELLPWDPALIEHANVQQLQRLINHAGLNYKECVEVAELRNRARHVLKVRKQLLKPGPIKRNGHVGHVLTPKVMRHGQVLPLLFVLHGAGRSDISMQRMVLQFSKVASRLGCIVVVPASHGSTWDMMTSIKRGAESGDKRFLASLLDDIRRDFYRDSGRIGILGFSDGASFALTLAVNNPQIFQAAMSWSAGYYEKGDSIPQGHFPMPRILHGHGRADDLFAFNRVAVPMRLQLRNMGYRVTTHTDKVAGHGTPPDFIDLAAKWWLALPPHHTA